MGQVHSFILCAVLVLACCACRARFNRSSPYVLDRNLTIRSSAPPELGQMDFQFLARKVLIAPQVTLRLEQLVLRNVNKLGGFGLDFFMVSVCVQWVQCSYPAATAGGAQHVTGGSSARHASQKCASSAGPLGAGPGSLHTCQPDVDQDCCLNALLCRETRDQSLKAATQSGSSWCARPQNSLSKQQGASVRRRAFPPMRCLLLTASACC